MHGVMETEHGPNIVSTPQVLPPPRILRKCHGTFAVIGVQHGHATVSTKHIGVGEKLVVGVKQHAAKANVVGHIVGDGEGHALVPGQCLIAGGRGDQRGE